MPVWHIGSSYHSPPRSSAFHIRYGRSPALGYGTTTISLPAGLNVFTAALIDGICCSLTQLDTEAIATVDARVAEARCVNQDVVGHIGAVTDVRAVEEQLLGIGQRVEVQVGV